MSGGHTPGPWEIDPDYRPGMSWNRHIVDGSGEGRICFMSNPGELGNHRECEANARLIAAAPDLLEALEVIAGGDVDVSGTAIIVGTGASTVMRQVRTAIAKARGEA